MDIDRIVNAVKIAIVAGFAAGIAGRCCSREISKTELASGPGNAAFAYGNSDGTFGKNDFTGRHIQTVASEIP